MNSVLTACVFSSETPSEGFLTFLPTGRNIYQRDSRARNLSSVISNLNVIFIGERGIDPSFQGTRFIRSLPSSSLGLRAPLPVALYKCGTNYFAYSQDIDLYGMGDSVEESIDDIKTMVVELWHDLHSEIDQLGPIPRQQLAALRQLIHEA